MASIHSYVVRYDSGFAPNPFHGYCTLATCKPDIRKHAKIGDWLVGCGSSALKTSGKLVYAMRVTEALSFDDYWHDPRFKDKKPIRNGSLKYVSGDNIYFREIVSAEWGQLDSFHTNDDGAPKPEHIVRDTGVNRVLISNEFYYFGYNGPIIPADMNDCKNRNLCKKGRGRIKIDDDVLLNKFLNWCRAHGHIGINGEPWDWK